MRIALCFLATEQPTGDINSGFNILCSDFVHAWECVFSICKSECSPGVEQPLVGLIKVRLVVLVEREVKLGLIVVCLFGLVEISIAFSRKIFCEAT